MCVKVAEGWVRGRLGEGGGKERNLDFKKPHGVSPPNAKAIRLGLAKKIKMAKMSRNRGKRRAFCFLKKCPHSTQVSTPH